jgi:hypothetical protein
MGHYRRSLVSPARSPPIHLTGVGFRGRHKARSTNQRSRLTREISEQGTTDRTPDEVADVTKFVIGNAVVLIEMPVEKLVKLAGGLPAENSIAASCQWQSGISGIEGVMAFRPLTRV